jgi:glycosyltransferase involved in cell wall biosynthesis
MPVVLDVVMGIKEIAQIICVDDGSDRGLGAVPASPRVKLVHLPENRGKAEAIREGLHLVERPYVLLLDADLRGLRAEEISRAAVSMMNDPHTDMIILRRVHSITSTKLLRGDVLFSGERILRVDDLVKVLASNPSRYQLEIAINKYMMEHNRRVCWMPSSAVNTLKVQKLGWLTGLVREANMIGNVLSYCGLSHYLLQLLFFARKQAIEPIASGVVSASSSASGG